MTKNVNTKNGRDKLGRFVLGFHHTEVSKKKISETHKGEKSYLWKGGISKFDHVDRVRFRETIQKQVFERDNYTCQICGIKGGNLQVDHIQPWAEYVEGRFDINNCRTLCIKCHYKITFGKEMPENVKTWGHNFREMLIKG